jgi:hypothetical protein
LRDDEIVAGARARPFVRGAAKDEAVVASSAGEVVPASLTEQTVVVWVAVEIVVAISATQELVSFGASVDPGVRITYAAFEGVGWVTSGGRTRATVDVVGAIAAEQGVSADSAEMSSGPLPPSTTSSPARALTWSRPPRAWMSSSTWEPVIRSFCWVPRQGPPRHWMLAAKATPANATRRKLPTTTNNAALLILVILLQ